MSASANVLQLVRAHFRRDDAAFASAALALGRAAKTPAIQSQILEAVRGGHVRHGSAPAANPMPRAPAPGGALETLLPTSFGELMLEPDVQSFLDEIVIELEYREELLSRKLRARSRLLFCGPPGNGKTSSASALANALGVPAYGVSLSRLVSKYMGETGGNLDLVFAALRPDTVVVFDEIDAVGSARASATSAAGKEANATVNVLLTMLDRRGDGVVIATTNRADVLDPALLRRFDEQIFFPPPTHAQKSALASKLCGHFGVPLVDVSTCENFDAVTKTVQREARRQVMRELLAEEEREGDPPQDPNANMELS